MNKLWVTLGVVGVAAAISVGTLVIPASHKEAEPPLKTAPAANNPPLDLSQIGEKAAKKLHLRNVENLRLAKASVGSLPLTIKGSGHVETLRAFPLSFTTADNYKDKTYPVEGIYVTEGEEVKSGQILAKLDTTMLETDVETARKDLENAELNLKANELKLEQLLEEKYGGHNLVDAISNMRNTAVATNQTVGELINLTLEGLSNLPVSEVGAAVLPQSQKAVSIPPPPSIPNQPSSSSGRPGEYPPAPVKPSILSMQPLKSAKKMIDMVEKVIRQLEGYQGKVNELFSRVDSVRHAIKDYQEVRAGPENYDAKKAQLDIEYAQVNVDKAKLALKKAEEDLAGAEIRVPSQPEQQWIVDNIAIQEGQPINGHVEAITIVDPMATDIVIDVGEVDVNDIRPGQEVRVYLDALPFIELGGIIKSVPVQAEGKEIAGVVTYAVQAELLDLPPREVIQLRQKQSALVEIVIGVEKNVLWVPSEAIQPGGNVLVVREDGEIEERKVGIGKVIEDRTQIIRGLSEGEVVAIV